MSQNRLLLGQSIAHSHGNHLTGIATAITKLFSKNSKKIYHHKIKKLNNNLISEFSL